MPNKFRIAFDVDLGLICPELLTEDAGGAQVAEDTFKRMLLAFARQKALRDIQTVRTSTTIPAADKPALMAACLQRVKLCLQAEANLSVDELPADAVIRNDTPEREALAA